VMWRLAPAVSRHDAGNAEEVSTLALKAWIGDIERLEQSR